jgi:predicted DNA-binding transcriptional regulator AlpA
MNEDRLLRLDEVLGYIPFGKTKFYEMMKEVELLNPIKYGRTNLWKLSKIQKFIISLDEKQVV